MKLVAALTGLVYLVGYVVNNMVFSYSRSSDASFQELLRTSIRLDELSHKLAEDIAKKVATEGPSQRKESSESVAGAVCCYLHCSLVAYCVPPAVRLAS